ncbi:MAG TPA: protein kinase [Kofleriaceae bacterium]|nr:protein kinase [Kofleriaceae bacterium]
MAFEGSERFEILHKLGEGGMGVVYEALDRGRDMRVALKALRRVDPISLVRFKSEFRAVTALSHPNIVNLYELIADADDWFFTMELVPGDDLVSFVRAGRTLPPVPATDPAPGDPLPSVEHCVDLARLRTALQQLAAALHALHLAGLVHRDLKPSNVRVTPEQRVVLMDFGIVADNRRGGDRTTSAPVGTPLYMAPEQAVGEPPSAAADWYAFGVMLYLALTGRLPFRGTRREILLGKQQREPLAPSQVVTGIPRDLDLLCRGLLRRRPHQRPSGPEILRTLGGTPGPAAHATDALSAHPVFVGRQLELDALAACYDRTLRGETTTIAIEGESGMGKSTLAWHFLETLTAAAPDRARPFVFTGRCHERESVAFKAFDSVVDDLAGALAGLTEETVATLLPADLSLLARIFPSLRRVAGVRSLTEIAAMDLHDLRGRAIDALRTLLVRLSELRPVVLFIDDLHWADGDSLELLRELMRQDSQLGRVLLITAVRTENLLSDDRVRAAIDALVDRGVMRQLAVGPLSNHEQRALVSQLTPSAAHLDQLGEAFWTQFRESPLFVVELFRYLEEADTGRETVLSLGLDDVLQRRIELLEPAARTMLEVVALSGEPLPLGVLARAAGLRPDDAERAAAVLRVGQLVRVSRSDREPWLVCNHDRLRAVLVESLDDARLTTLHTSTAAALEGWADATPVSLARHWLAAADPARGVHYLRVAARVASDKLAFDQAAELLERAVAVEGEHPERGALLVALADALVLAGRCFEAARRYEDAAALASGAEVLELRRRAADNLVRSGHFDEGLAQLGQVLQALGARVARTRRGAAVSFVVGRGRLLLRGLGYRTREPGDVSARALGRLDTIHAASMTLGIVDHVRGAALQTRHLRAALQVGEERRVLRALAIEIAYSMPRHGRRGRRGERLANQVLQRARALGDEFLTGLTLMTMGGAEFLSGRPRRAIEHLHEAEALLTGVATNAEWERVTARYFLGLAYAAIGDLHGVVATAERSLAAADRRRDLYARTMFLCIPRTLQRLRDDRPDDAEQELDDALIGWPSRGYYIGNYLEAYSRILIDLYRGQGARALASIDATWPGARELMLHRMPWIEGELRSLEARAALLTGDTERARRATARVERTGMAYTAHLARLFEASLAAADGDQARARNGFEAARAGFAEIGALHLVAACDAKLGNRHAALGWAEAQRVVNPPRWWALLTGARS